MLWLSPVFWQIIPVPFWELCGLCHLAGPQEKLLQVLKTSQHDIRCACIALKLPRLKRWALILQPVGTWATRVNPHVCLTGTLLFVWRKGKVVASSQAPWLCYTGADKRKLLEELEQSWRWGAWCLGQRRTCEPLPASLLLPTSWMTSSAAWPGLGSSSPPAPACGLKDRDNCHSSSPLKWILILCRNKFQTPQHRALLCSPPHTREGWTAALYS